MLSGVFSLEEKHYAPPPGGRGYSSQFGIGVCRQGSQALTLFKGRKSRIDTLLNAQNQEMAPYLRETRQLIIV